MKLGEKEKGSKGKMHITVWQCSEGIMHYVADLGGYAPLYSAILGKPEDGRDKERATCPTDSAGHSHVHRGSKESESHDYLHQTSNPFIPLKSQRFASRCVVCRRTHRRV